MLESEGLLTHEGITYVSANEALTRVAVRGRLSITGAYRLITKARAAGELRMLSISSRQRWFAIEDLERLVDGMKTTSSRDA